MRWKVHLLLHLLSFTFSIKIILFLNLEGRPIDTDLKKKAAALQNALDWEDAGPQAAALLGGTDTGISQL